MKKLWKQTGNFLLTVCLALGFAAAGVKWLLEAVMGRTR